jgi:hypothetical protein
MWIDTHCHLDAAEFSADRDAVAAAAVAAGVTKIVVPAVEVANFAAVRQCCQRYPGCLPAYGIHPMYTPQATDADLDVLRDWLQRERPVAVGEIGLDHFVEGLDPARQLHLFVEQLKLAREFDLPVLLHVRRAVDPILRELRRIGVRGGIAHAFNACAGTRAPAASAVPVAACWSACKDGRVVATQGDPDAPVNRGLNCIKGYFLSKIMYGKDRLTKPLLRMKDGKYDKNGEFTPISWDQAFDIMAEKCKAALKEDGPARRRHVRLRPMDGLGRLCRRQADEGRLPHQQPRPQRAPLHGLGRRRLHAHLRHRRADGLLRRHRARRRLRAVGLEHGRDAPDPVVAHHRPPPDRNHVKVHVLSTFEHRSCELADNR